MNKRCEHNGGWYATGVSLLADSDGENFTVLPDYRSRADRTDKVLMSCNLGCGATRNVYLTEAAFTFGKIRRSRPLPSSEKEPK